MNREPQNARQVMMIRPVAFTGNVQTRGSNAFQQVDSQTDALAVQAQARQEFEALSVALTAAGVQVHVFDDTAEPHTPDSIFPNNWVSFHADGTVVLYPMLAPNRRVERRVDLLDALRQHGLGCSRLVDLSGHEAQAQFLEGTGSMVLDRQQRIAYACLSPRTHLAVLQDFAAQLEYQICAFDAHDAQGMPIYHTNVLMCIGERFAVVCSPAIAADQREQVLDSLRSGGRELVELTLAQMNAFAGNMLELATADGGRVLALSARAHASLDPDQLQALQRCTGRILPVAVDTIEHHGGGSVRCMLAEVHLPMAATND